MATNAQTLALSTISITATAPATFDIAGYDALVDWTEIGEITDLGGHGDEYTEVTHLPVNTRRVQKLKGSVNAGSETYTLADDIDDAGQVVMKAALASDADYYFMETWQDGTIEYFAAKVMSFAGTGGNADTVRARTVTVGINSEILEKAPV